MTTTRDIIERAHRKIGVVASDEPMTADQAQSGLDALNMMMHGWALVMPLWAHTNTTLNSTFPMEPAFHEGVVYQLAARLAPNFMVQGFDPDQWFRALQNRYTQAPVAAMPSALLRTSSQRRWVR